MTDSQAMSSARALRIGVIAVGIPGLVWVLSRWLIPAHVALVGDMIHFAGLIFVGWGLVETACATRSTTPLAVLRSGVLASWDTLRFWKRDPPPVKGSGAATFPPLAADLHGTTTMEADLASPDLPTRVATLEAEMREVREDIKDVQGKGREREKVLLTQLEAEREERKEAVNQLSTLVTRLWDGAIRTEFVGLCWLGLGFLISTFG